MVILLNVSGIFSFHKAVQYIKKHHRNKWEACLIDFNGNLFPKKNLLVQCFPS